MSDVRNESVIRFRFADDFCKKIKTWHQMFEYIVPILNTPPNIDYKYSKVDNQYEKTNEVEYFNYSKEKGTYSIKKENGIWYLDYHIITSDYSCDDFVSTINLPDLLYILDNTYKLFNNEVTGPKIMSYQWYTGCDEPIEY